MSWGFIAVKRHCDHSNSYNEKHLIGVGLQFRGLVNYRHGEKNGDMQAHMVLERKVTEHLGPQVIARD